MDNITNSSVPSPLANLTLDSNETAANITYSFSPLQFLHANFDLLAVQLRIVVSAITIIILSAYGALRRPPSAAPSAEPALTPLGKRRRKRHREMESFAEGLQASDAIMFPVMAGITLIGLYYLIQWLRDPAILNRILTGYLSLMSVASLGKLFADGLSVVTGLLFPAVWADGKGRVFKIDAVGRFQWRLEKGADDGAELQRAKDHYFRLPFPLLCPRFVRPQGFNSRAFNTSWTIRRLVKEEWTVKIAAHGIGKGEFGVTLADAMGGVLALVVAVVYTLTGSSTLSNLMGAGLCYGALLIMSCTSFVVGSLVLVGLFFYDIVMVFYTPFMITVATKLDAPIKLTFQAGKASTLLGLGDIVVPGIFICLALRFDLWRHYQQKIKYVPRDLKTETKSSEDKNATSSTPVTTTEQKMQAVKTPFINPQGRWGDWFWTLPSPSNSPVLAKAAPALTASSFQKPYFNACIIGYLAGMLATLVVLFIFKRGQPALLYLVPGVVGAVWITGAIRGEIGELWMYTEDGSLDTVDVVVEVDGNGKVMGVVRVEEVAEKKDGEKEKEGAAKDDKKDDKEKDKKGESQATASKDNSDASQGHDVFVFSIHAPGDDEIDEDDV